MLTVKEYLSAMSASSKSKSTHPCNPKKSPWDDLDADGKGLSVTDFLTTQVINTGNALRKRITLSYAKQFGMSPAEWRILSVLAHARRMDFSQLALSASTDKGSLVRMLRSMQGKGFLTTVSEGAGSQKKVTCTISPKGADLYDQVMPIARRRQAEMLLELAPEHRRVLYHSLGRLLELCGPQDDDSHDA
ncbi:MULTISPECIES: MarR family winged helix-turn-helix transcriptional regulator [unclassified Variovorax]|uniref:MarR family winged helix-turn-helix transcriptional regulator n=1 Tax=unclassified Variovorax TaxID=663243 RepID=UPI001BD3D5CE|nr:MULTISPECIES: MarR family winged helix-turn-helix transcriptional regulator [unclassified Variovorax]